MELFYALLLAVHVLLVVVGGTLFLLSMRHLFLVQQSPLLHNYASYTLTGIVISGSLLVLTGNQTGAHAALLVKLSIVVLLTAAHYWMVRSASRVTVFASTSLATMLFLVVVLFSLQVQVTMLTALISFCGVLIVSGVIGYYRITKRTETVSL